MRQIALKEKRMQDQLLEITLTKRISKSLSKNYENFSIWFFSKLHTKLQSAVRYISQNYGVEMAYCHGCSTKEPKENTSQKVFIDNLGNNVTVNLCEDCLRDCEIASSDITLLF